MILSRILMVLALAVLAYLVFMTMTGSDSGKNKASVTSPTAPQATTTAPPATAGSEQFSSEIAKIKPEHFTKNENTGCSVNPQPIVPQMVQLQKQENFIATPETIVYEPAKQTIKYETFADIGGMADTVHGAAPFGGKSEMDEGSFAKVSYTGLVDGTPGDVIQIEGTDLLTAPLVENMLYTNSIANTNRNASQDLRGDIPLQFNETYTPFYSSVIYGAPLSQKQMTIGNI